MANQRILEHFRSQRQTLLAEAHSAGIFSSSSNIGTSRETYISEFLERHLPRMFRTCKGEITDSQNHYSSEIDIIVYRDDFPAIEISTGTTIVLAETVAAAIEVKSELTSQEVQSAVQKGARLQTLTRNFGPTLSLGSPPSSIPYYVIGYRGTTLETLTEQYNSFPIVEEDVSAANARRYAPEGIINLEGDFGIFCLDGMSEPARLTTDSLAWFFLALHAQISRLVTMAPPLDRYFLEERT